MDAVAVTTPITESLAQLLAAIPGLLVPALCCLALGLAVCGLADRSLGKRETSGCRN